MKDSSPLVSDLTLRFRVEIVEWGTGHMMRKPDVPLSNLDLRIFRKNTYPSEISKRTLGK